MPDSGAFWLTVTNVALGVGVGLCMLVTAASAVHEILGRRKQRRTRFVE